MTIMWPVLIDWELDVKSVRYNWKICPESASFSICFYILVHNNKSDLENDYYLSIYTVFRQLAFEMGRFVNPPYTHSAHRQQGGSTGLAMNRAPGAVQGFIALLKGPSSVPRRWTGTEPYFVRMRTWTTDYLGPIPIDFATAVPS